MSNNFTTNIVNGITKRLNKVFDNTYKKAGVSRTQEIIIKHLPEKGQHTTTLFGKPFSFSERNGFLHSLKEIFVDEVYIQELPPDAYILDCGANIGLSILYLKRLSPGARIIAFEPDETNFVLLQKNTEAFSFSNVELRKEAIWIENTFIEFSNSGTLGSKIVDNNGTETVKVKAARLKDMMTQPIDFLKLDIEGAEYKVVKDIQDNLHFADKIFIEYHGLYSQNGELNDLLQIVVSRGFHYSIKEAYNNPTPFRSAKTSEGFDLQLNIFCKKS